MRWQEPLGAFNGVMGLADGKFDKIRGRKCLADADDGAEQQYADKQKHRAEILVPSAAGDPVLPIKIDSVNTQEK